MAYTAPTVAQFRTRYAAFADVASETVQYWLDEADGDTGNWSDETRPRGVMAYAAHKMAEQGLGTGAMPAGVTSFKSGTFSATVSDAQAGRTGFNSTVYGREFLDLARRNFGGPRLAYEPNVSVG
ncbi:DUF4054 domain-containing protein [Erythrobacter sp. SCSIO 43205]|uniref:DUF4054 domain-containing protein n=1 Tax=Erythrobacter sp. SCSIO 43205 TaxID=2779361 RepID=UPI001CA8ADC9|nr:DUF4054 domain-containing protein [Erythrobacter sp. SCSIO 43205]UAB76964.1 DUF4054 domain-containing protein [Erythrobacter sp. SCSIO 43205]